MPRTFLEFISRLLAEVAIEQGASSKDSEKYIALIEGNTRLEAKEREKAKANFENQLANDITLDELVRDFRKHYSKKPDSILACCEKLLRASKTDKTKRLVAKIKGIYSEQKLAKHFMLLGLPADASLFEVRRSYRTLARKLHPDTRSSDEKYNADLDQEFQEIREAYVTICESFKQN